MDVEITIEKKKPDNLKSFETINWPKADKEHYGTNDLDLSRHIYYLIAREKESILGFACVEIDAGVISIEDILVNYDHHRQGIGTKLLSKIEALAVDKNCHVIELITGKDWNARKLYEGFKYKVLCELPNYYARRDFILMVKRLPKTT